MPDRLTRTKRPMPILARAAIVAVALLAILMVIKVVWWAAKLLLFAGVAGGVMLAVSPRLRQRLGLSRSSASQIADRPRRRAW